MAGKGSFGTSWADQWDPDEDSATGSSAKSSKPKGSSLSTKVEDGMKKVKDGSSSGFKWAKEGTVTGFKKAKEGTASGFKWAKGLYEKKSTQKP